MRGAIWFHDERGTFCQVACSSCQAVQTKESSDTQITARKTCQQAGAEIQREDIYIEHIAVQQACGQSNAYYEENYCRNIAQAHNWSASSSCGEIPYSHLKAETQVLVAKSHIGTSKQKPTYCGKCNSTARSLHPNDRSTLQKE